MLTPLFLPAVRPGITRCRTAPLCYVCLGRVTAQLSFLLSTPLLVMKHEAVDRLMRDSILLRKRTE